MRAILGQFDMRGRIGRLGFWTGFAAHFAFSVALLLTWLAACDFLGVLPGTLAVSPVRLLLIGPQISMYVRRLRDAGLPVGGVFVLLAVWGLALAAAAADVDQAIAAGHGCDEGTYDDCDTETFSWLFAAIAGYGPLTGLPGPFSLLIAVIVGLKRGHAKAPGAAPGA